MAKPPHSALSNPPSRAEKLSILSAMLGPDALARVRDGQSDPASLAPEIPVEVDKDRASWHRNKLLERLRQQAGTKLEAGKDQASAAGQTEPKARPESPRGSLDDQRIFGSPSAGLDARLSKISDASMLEQEHPAIIARLIKTLPRDERVEALKSLPGPIARSIVRRLR